MRGRWPCLPEWHNLEAVKIGDPPRVDRWAEKPEQLLHSKLSSISSQLPAKEDWLINLPDGTEKEKNLDGERKAISFRYRKFGTPYIE